MRIGRQQGRRVRPGLASGCQQLLLPSQFHRVGAATLPANPPTMTHLYLKTPSGQDKIDNQSSVGPTKSHEKKFFVKADLPDGNVVCSPGCVPGL